MSETLPFAPACERNKQPILAVLQQVLPNSGTVLEIGSATGQHVVYFSAHLPQLQWQPSDRPEYLPGLRHRLRVDGGANIHPPIMLDVLERWPDQVFDAVYAANTAHIMGWPAVCVMFAGVAPRLVMGGVFCLYGPFNPESPLGDTPSLDLCIHKEFSSVGNTARYCAPSENPL